MKLVTLLILLSLQAFSSDAAYNRGETLFYARACSSCHGASAEGSSSYPRLANKKEKFLLEKLHYFKAGKADTVSRQMMAQFAQKLSEKDIQDLAYYLSRHKKVAVEDVANDLLGVDY
jgi:cytochrome c553